MWTKLSNKYGGMIDIVVTVGAIVVVGKIVQVFFG